jgi:hypothetical protein
MYQNEIQNATGNAIYFKSYLHAFGLVALSPNCNFILYPIPLLIPKELRFARFVAGFPVLTGQKTAPPAPRFLGLGWIRAGVVAYLAAPIQNPSR